MTDYTLDVHGMSCEGCEHILQTELARLSGIGDADPDADTGTVRVHGDPGTKTRARQAVLDAGYDIRD